VRRLALLTSIVLGSSGALVIIAIDACSSFKPTADVSDGGGADGGAVEGGSASDAPANEAAVDASPPASYARFDDPAKWLITDLKTITGTAGNFSGGAFDGRYMYLTPAMGTAFVRLDTTADPNVKTSWTGADLGFSTYQYIGAGFDGRFVVEAPWEISGGANNFLIRYDTHTPFDLVDGGGWERFQMKGTATDYFGVGSAPSKLYLQPYGQKGSQPVLALANGAPIEGGLTYVDEGNPPGSFHGGVHADDGYYYFAPCGGSAPGLVLRMLESSEADGGATFETFDYSMKSGINTARGFGGAVYDGRYVYFVPFFDAGAYQSTAIRYDTKGSFTEVGSWDSFTIASSVASKAVGFLGGAFDGRYVYFAPNRQNDAPTYNTTAVRFDTTAAKFSDSSAWTTFDLSTLTSPIGGFEGVIFDGEHVFFIPRELNVMLRFDARTPRTTPPQLPGSL
jgi:hypothetical protein